MGRSLPNRHRSGPKARMACSKTCAFVLAAKSKTMFFVARQALEGVADVLVAVGPAHVRDDQAHPGPVPLDLQHLLEVDGVAQAPVAGDVQHHHPAAPVEHVELVRGQEVEDPDLLPGQVGGRQVQVDLHPEEPARRAASGPGPSPTRRGTRTSAWGGRASGPRSAM